MGRRRRSGNPTAQKTNHSREVLMGNEENEYLVPHPNRIMISITNELSGAYKKISQRGNYG
jgi:hypothetical protein